MSVSQNWSVKGAFKFQVNIQVNFEKHKKKIESQCT